MNGCVLLTSTPECVVSPRRAIPRAAPSGSPGAARQHTRELSPRRAIPRALGIARRGETTHSGVDVNNTHPSMINPLIITRWPHVTIDRRWHQQCITRRNNCNSRTRKAISNSLDFIHDHIHSRSYTKITYPFPNCSRLSLGMDKWFHTTRSMPGWKSIHLNKFSCHDLQLLRWHSMDVAWVRRRPKSPQNSTNLFSLTPNKSLTHWGRDTHISVSKLTIIDSDNGLSPDRRQTIIWTNTGILLIGILGTNFSETLSEIQTFSFKKTYLKMSSGKWRPFCLGFDVLKNHSPFVLWIHQLLYCLPS